MNPDERRLARHLGIAILAKVAGLALLWWLFFSHFQAPAPGAAASPVPHVVASPRGETP